MPNNIIAGRGSAPSVQGKGDFPHRLVYQTLYVETVAWKWSVVMHEAARQFARQVLFARSVRLVVGDVKRWRAFIVVTSEKSIARSARMYNIRFDLRADRKLDRMKRLRRYNRKQPDETVPRFWGGAGLTLRRRYFASSLFHLQRRRLHSMNQRFGVCSIRRNRRLLVEASTHVFERAGVVCGGVRRAT